MSVCSCAHAAMTRCTPSRAVHMPRYAAHAARPPCPSADCDTSQFGGWPLAGPAHHFVSQYPGLQGPPLMRKGTVDTTAMYGRYTYHAQSSQQHTMIVPCTLHAMWLLRSGTGMHCCCAQGARLKTRHRMAVFFCTVMHGVKNLPSSLPIVTASRTRWSAPPQGKLLALEVTSCSGVLLAVDLQESVAVNKAGGTAPHIQVRCTGHTAHAGPLWRLLIWLSLH
jgi:hypothetical protein